MKQEALFINGVFDGVLEEILLVQRHLPDQIMFLQPYRTDPITHLRDDQPTVEDPMRLFLSVTNNLATVSYSAEIVGWDDKRKLSKEERSALSRLIWTLQPNEGGLYNESPIEGKESLNLIYIRRLSELPKPFPVSRLIKTSDSAPLSTGRTTAGGFSYVKLRDG
jgi:hypothetical protein